MDSILNIGVSLGGSMGDIVNLSSLCLGLKRKFPQSKITLFVFGGSEIVRDNRIISTIALVRGGNFNEEIKHQRANFDIFCEVRYPVKYFFSDNALKNPEVLAFKTYWEVIYKQYYEKMWEQFLGNIKLIDNYCTLNNETIYDLRRNSSCLDYTDDDQFISITDMDMVASKNLEGLRLVTVNNSGVGGKMTKSWSTQGFEKVIQHLKKRGLYVVQLGTAKEPDLPGIHSRFYGTIHETAAVIKRSKFGIFIEGGLVHLAKAVGRPSIVLFGPTPVQNFGYRSNINIKGTQCSPCWHVNNGNFDWNKICVKSGKSVDEELPVCMKYLGHGLVTNAVDETLNKLGMLSKDEMTNV